MGNGYAIGLLLAILAAGLLLFGAYALGGIGGACIAGAAICFAAAAVVLEII